MNQRVLARKPANASAPSRRASGNRLGNSLSGRPVPSSVHQVVNSPGVPLSANARAFFEPRFGFDFSRVRVHADSGAAASARAVDAAAYTVGQHIAFDSGKYQPHSRQGMQLLGHELAHTVQQNGASQGGDLRMGSPTDASEKEADRASFSTLSDTRAEIHSQRPMSVQRQPNQAVPQDLDLDKGLTENASPMMATVMGSMTIDQFETGKPDIPARRKSELARTAKNILNLKSKYFGSTIRVIGNTDAVGKDADNQSLGQSRADSVKGALVALGVPAESIQTESRGASNLVVKSKMENGRNRRVEVQFSPGRQLPGVMSSRLGLTGDGPTGNKDFSSPVHVPIGVSPNRPGLNLPVDYDPKPQPPYRPKSDISPDLFKPLPSMTPKNLVDFQGYNKNLISHANRPDVAGDPTEAVAKGYLQCMGTMGPGAMSEKVCKMIANLQISTTVGADQSRDNPNTEDQINQQMKQAYPNSTGIPPIPLPPIPF